MEASIRNYQCISCSILFRETVSPSLKASIGMFTRAAAFRGYGWQALT